MTSLDPDPQRLAPRPSWVAPVTAGAVTTLLLHAPALMHHFLWLPVCCTFGCSGAPVGLLPALLALRRDPYMGAASGFAVSFLGVGIGGVALAAWTAVQGFDLGPDFEQELRSAWLEAGHTEEEIVTVLDGLREIGPLLPVVSAGFLALSAGVVGAVLAAWTDRRRRRWSGPRDPGSGAAGAPPGPLPPGPR